MKCEVDVSYIGIHLAFAAMNGGGEFGLLFCEVRCVRREVIEPDTHARRGNGFAGTESRKFAGQVIVAEGVKSGRSQYFIGSEAAVPASDDVEHIRHVPADLLAGTYGTLKALEGKISYRLAAFFQGDRKHLATHVLNRATKAVCQKGRTRQRTLALQQPPRADVSGRQFVDPGAASLQHHHGLPVC